MSDERPVSLQDAIRRRGETRFVGRRRELDDFHENLELGLDDPARSFVFHIHGESGVGKSTLMRQMRRLSVEAGGLTAWSDSSSDAVIEPMEEMARQLEDGGVSMRSFFKRYNEYHTNRTTLLADSNAPEGLSQLLLTLAVKAGLGTTKSVPVLGEALEPLTESVTAEQIDRARQFVVRKVGSKSTAALLLDPIPTLSALLCKSLTDYDSDQLVALFIDTFERREGDFGTWLRALIRGKYGALPLSFVLLVSGQHRPDYARWSEFEAVSTSYELNVFTEDEARKLLREHGVTSDEVGDIILESTGRLPVLVSLLAQNGPRTSADVIDPAEGVIEWFLRNEVDEVRRELALAGAVPRKIDNEVVAVVSGIDPHASVPILKAFSFSNTYNGVVRYHDIVRRAMVRVLRTSSRKKFEEIHRRLYDFYDARYSAVSNKVSDDANSVAEELFYHGLCADPASFPEMAIFAETSGRILVSDTALRRWSTMLDEAWLDTDHERLAEYARLTRLCLDEGDTGRLTFYNEFVRRIPAEDEELRKGVLLERASYLTRLDREIDALPDYVELIEKYPNDLEIVTPYSFCLIFLNRAQEAVTLLDQVIPETQTDAEDLLVQKGFVLVASAQYEQALLLLNEVPAGRNHTSAATQRARALRELGRHDEALHEISIALESAPESIGALLQLMLLQEARQEYEVALETVDTILGQLPDDAFYLHHRGVILQNLERFRDAVESFRESGNSGAIDRYRAHLDLAETLRFQGRYADARDEYQFAFEISKGATWSRRSFLIVRIAEMARLLGDPQRCVSTLERAPTLDNTIETLWCDYTRALACVQLGSWTLFYEALNKIRQTLQAETSSEDLESVAWLFNSALALNLLGDGHLAEASFDRLLSHHTLEPFECYQARMLIEESINVLGDAGDLDRFLARLAGPTD